MSVVGRIVLQAGDITQAEVDAVVNAANSELVLGSGVAGAIREGGGPSIQAECDALGPIEVGSAALTGAGDLPARHVIHAASMPLGGRTTEASLRASTRRALGLAAEHGLRSVALPAIGTGVGGLGLQRCAEIMLEEAQRQLDGPSSLEEIRFVLFGEAAYRVFEQVHDAMRIRAQLERMRR
jgi:O-acetyl-ADP-ribose deacetylase (regulator of RNase III)